MPAQAQLRLSLVTSARRRGSLKAGIDSSKQVLRRAADSLREEAINRRNAVRSDFTEYCHALRFGRGEPSTRHRQSQQHLSSAKWRSML